MASDLILQLYLPGLSGNTGLCSPAEDIEKGVSRDVQASVLSC